MEERPSEHAGFGIRRRDATLLFITFVTAVAFENGIDQVEAIFEHTSTWLSYKHWILPGVFAVTLLRFAFGSYIHMLTLERDKVVNGIWFVDLVVIFVLEMAIIAFMAFFFEPDNVIPFAALLAALCLVDAAWITSVLITKCCGWRKSTERYWPWLAMNGVSGVAALIVLSTTDWIAPSRGLWLVAGWFTAMALIDFWLQLSGFLNPILGKQQRESEKIGQEK